MSTQWVITLYAKYIEYIRTGEKTSEGRCDTKMFQPIEVGDTIKFYSSKENFVIVQVLAKNKYKTFGDLVKGEGVQALIPDLKATDVEKATKIYHSIPGYTKKEGRFGVVAFQIKVI